MISDSGNIPIISSNSNKYSMYEYKVFDTRTGQEVPDVEKLTPSHANVLIPDRLKPINDLLDKLAIEGWEPMDVDYMGCLVFCRRSLTLTD